MIKEGRFQALVGERTVEFEFNEGRLTMDGEEVTYAFAPISDQYYSLLVDGRSVPVVVEPTKGGYLRVTLEGRQTEVRVKDEKALLLERFGLAHAAGVAEREIRAPMPGLVLRVVVEPGEAVEEDDGLLVLEAMKMENEIRAPVEGIVKAVHVDTGDAVDKNALLIEFEG